MEKKKPALEHDITYLQDRIPLFVSVNCVACGSDNHSVWGEKMKFTYSECGECKTIFMNPRGDENLMGEFYKQSKNYAFWNKYIFPASDEIRKEKIFRPRANKTVGFCKKYGVKGGTMLEIGSAFGTYCEAVSDLKYFERIVAVEPTPGLAETCREKGIETFEQTIEDLEFKKESVDVVANFEVIEHLSNPKKFIQQSADLLRKGGIFICTCPSGTGLGTLVLKEQAKVVDHEHVNYFNGDSLSLVLAECGLETLEVSTPGELDAEMLYSEFKSNPEAFKTNSFFSHLFQNLNDTTLGEFQQFLKDNLLSSHLWIVARKV